jgi:ABC-2 type transport system ATP-binding protein
LIKDEILQLRDEGATVIFSTHRMESVEELCDHIALIHESNKILDGKLTDIKRQFKTNTFEVGLQTDNIDEVTRLIKDKFEVFPATFKNLNDDLKLNIKLNANDTSNDLLSFLTSKAEVHHFVEVVPSANDIFIQTVKNN